MKALLDAIKVAVLGSSTFSYLQERVYISIETRDAVFFPASFSCPCMVISPGVYDITWLPADSTDETKFVNIAVYRYFRGIDSALLGDGDEKGILEMMDDARTFLVHKDLGLSYDEVEVQRVESPEPYEFASQENTAIRQSMSLIYSTYQQ